MTVNHPFGRAGGPATQQVREFGDITVSSIQHVDLGTSSILADASAVTGNADSYYLIWGFSVNHSSANAAYGYIESNEGTPENIAPFAVTAAGPIFQSLGLPIRLSPGAGVQSRTLANPDGIVLVSVHYTVHS